MKQPAERNRHEIDAAGQSVGRLASRIAMILRGKHKATYTPHIDDGDLVTVINAGQLKFTGKKLVQKDFKRHSMHPGGLKVVSVKKVFDQSPEKVVRHAVAGMLAKNNQRTTLLKRLTVKP